MPVTKERISALKTLVHVIGLAALAAISLSALAGPGAEQPLKWAFPLCGLTAVTFLLLTLAVTPASRVLKAPLLIALRRPCGLWCFAWAAGHAGLFAARLNFDFTAIPGIAAKHPFIIPGQLAFLILCCLAATSSQWAMKTLGRNWRRLHRLVYLAAVAAAAHFCLASGFAPLAVIYAALFAALLLFRLKPAR